MALNNECTIGKQFPRADHERKVLDVVLAKLRHPVKEAIGATTHSLDAETSHDSASRESIIKLLNDSLATELVCVLRYTQHSIVATGLASDSVREEFAEHAKEEHEHAMSVAERINQLGGAPDFNPDSLTARSASEYQTGDDLEAMIRENLVAERIAIDHYRELIRYFGDNDPASRTMMESILAVEEEHASDMLDLLAVHGKH
jgi:bacterioferritin